MPKWNNPYPNFRLSDYEYERIKKNPVNILRINQRMYQDTLDAIEDGTYYMRPDFAGGYTTWFNGGERVSRGYLDRARYYTLLWETEKELEAKLAIDNS